MSIVAHSDFYRGTETQVFGVRGAGFSGKLIRLDAGYHSPIFAPTIASVVAASRAYTDEIHSRVTQTLSAPLPFGQTFAPWLSGVPEGLVAPPPINWNLTFTHTAEVVLASGDSFFVALADQDPQLP